MYEQVKPPAPDLLLTAKASLIIPEPQAYSLPSTTLILPDGL